VADACRGDGLARGDDRGARGCVGGRQGQHVSHERVGEAAVRLQASSDSLLTCHEHRGFDDGEVESIRIGAGGVRVAADDVGEIVFEDRVFAASAERAGDCEIVDISLCSPAKKPWRVSQKMRVCSRALASAASSPLRRGCVGTRICAGPRVPRP